tara:strand:- start:182 stop:814 length:633 start_codon:yes stop_codon:yes gene_type:complete
VTISLLEIKELLPPDVKLLAVSKGQNESAIRSLLYNGQCDFGESRLQEALPKINKLSDMKSIKWHFVGRLQSNKVRGVVKTFDVIHSVHSLSLCERISRISGEENRSPQIMLQVKFREDTAKVGLSREELLDIWPKFKSLPNINITGLMTIPPINLDSDDRQQLFLECRNLSDSLGLKDCSMGMSRDWREAVHAGATWIRVGTLLFGNRV